MREEEKRASSPFLKERTKKLLLPGGADGAVTLVWRQVLGALLCLCLAGPALGQVSTDDKALDQLAPSPAAKPAQNASPPVTSSKTRKRPAPHSVAPAGKRLTPPSMPVAPPIHPVLLPPTFTMPAHPPPPPPPIPVLPDAAGVALPLPGGGRITFGAGTSDLNPVTLAAVQALAKQAAANPAVIVDVTAWAPGTADDPSTARRLSLDRALAVRAVLIHEGVLSDRIRAVAKGSLDIGAGPADRADFAVEIPGKK